MRCESPAELIEEFVRTSTCRRCHIAIRSYYCNKSLVEPVREQFLANP
jgi:hypothetical protein